MWCAACAAALALAKRPKQVAPDPLILDKDAPLSRKTVSVSPTSGARASAEDSRSFRCRDSQMMKLW